MEMHSQKFLQRRRFLMVLPLLVLPFLTMMFWILGGGQTSTVLGNANEKAGLNWRLPDAHFNNKEVWDKLRLYEMADRDSARYEQARERDPYFDLIAVKPDQQQPANNESEKQGELIDSFPKRELQLTDPNEERVNKKLEELYKEIHKPDTNPVINQKSGPIATSRNPQFTEDVDRLEKMMDMMNDKSEPDPEMQQIENVLEKILDIQHPQRVKEKLKSINDINRENAFPVEVVNGGDDISMFQSIVHEQLVSHSDSATFYQSLLSGHIMQNDFYGLNGEFSGEVQSSNVIEAVIHDTQELVAGSTVKMRLLNDVVINGATVHKDQFIYGQCAINQERLTIDINSIHAGNSLLPVALSVYDLDGLEGIYIPGAVTRDAGKKASNDALQNIQLMSLDPSIGAQAASAGVEAAKGLFSKKAKLIKITLKAGYRILLQDNNSIKH